VRAGERDGILRERAANRDPAQLPGLVTVVTVVVREAMTVTASSKILGHVLAEPALI
jgi:hypothetical protein